MASNIEMVTFAGQTVTPLDDALIYDAALTSGILSGCNVSLSGGNTIHIEGGHGIICGRKFTVFESDIPVPLSSGATLAGRLKVHMDLSDTGEPIQLVVESAATLPALEQDEDANINNGIYEFNIATFNVTTSEVTNFVQVFPSVGVDPEFIVNNMTTPAGTSGKALDARQANPNISGTLAALVAAKVAKTDIVNSGATAAGTSGKVLDARQANPAISGSLAYQISQLNSRINDAKAVSLTSDTMTLPSGITLHTANYYVKVGRVVMLYVSLKIESSTKASFNIKNYIPTDEDRPRNNTSFILQNGVADGLCQGVTINSDGSINIWNAKTGTTYAMGTVTYISKA